MNETLEKIGELGIVPVVKIEKAEDALLLGKARSYCHSYQQYSPGNSLLKNEKHFPSSRDSKRKGW